MFPTLDNHIVQQLSPYAGNDLILMANDGPGLKCWAYTSVSGGLENNLQMIDRPVPLWLSNPPRNKHAVEVICASLNPVDYKLPESPIESRVARIAKPATPGMDFCGRLVADPKRIVFGRLNWPAQHGTLGRYILVNEQDFADLPDGCTPEEGAAIPIAALTAYQSLVPFVKERSRVVIFGGSGGVGTFSVQIAKLLGAYVVAICSKTNEQLCRDLGADKTIDYTAGSVVEQLDVLGPFDLVIDNVGNDPTLHHRSSSFLKGRFVLVSGMLGSVKGIISMVDSLFRPTWLGGASNSFTIILCQSNKQQLQQIGDWVREKKVKVVIDEVYEYGDAPKALQKLRTGRARGKIVIRVGI